MAEDNREQVLELTATIVSAYIANNPVPMGNLVQLIADVANAVEKLGQPQPEPEAAPSPAVNPKRSVFQDHIISLENGKSFKSLTRHLSTLGMTPDEYRIKWGLAKDYPMVAPSYSAKRSELAKSLGLGRKPKTESAPAAADPETAPAPKKRGRPAKKAA